MLTAVVGIVMLLGLTACGSDQESIDPREVLSRSSARMKEIKGFHFVYEVHKPSSATVGQGLEIARITGDVNSEGHMKAEVDVTFAGTPFKLGFVAIGATHYLQDPLSGKWESSPADESPVGSLSLSAGTIRILDQIKDPVYEGKEEKGGTQTYHISGRAAAEDVDAIAGSVSTEEDFPTDLFIGIEDHYVYEVDIAGPATLSEDPGISRSIELSNLDTFVDIKAPQ